MVNVDEKSAQNKILHANLEIKLPQNLAAENNTTAPSRAHPKLSPYNSPKGIRTKGVSFASFPSDWDTPQELEEKSHILLEWAYMCLGVSMLEVWNGEEKSAKNLA